MRLLLEEIGVNARKAKWSLAGVPSGDRNRLLELSAAALESGADRILAENARDADAAEAASVKPALIDRLTLNAERIAGMAGGLRKVAALPDPVGEFFDTRTLPNGLIIGKKRVPLGVVAIIYESRPNVTSDAFGLCFKSGNAVILRGGKEAIRSNAAIVAVIRAALAKAGFDEDVIQLIPDTSRETAAALMKLNKYVDVLIPRGSASLIRSVTDNATIPTIETGVGNCHIYVDESADLSMAERIIVNAKVQRPGVCNACEKIVIHGAVADAFLPRIAAALSAHGVELRGDERAAGIAPAVSVITDPEEWFEEYLDLKIGIKISDSLDDAIRHIRAFTSGHSEAIITESYAASQRFLADIDAAAVYVNASTRFTDGEEFGLGAEIGISTQKLHARGPMGLRELTSYKYVVYGDGQIRG
ncbi:MAG: glutamate-5-semialdehyde dehydrogenase [Clostridiales bacterium]|nr:glutamate-5-semialdehyde dehydrogenase [Clostridiales bacterium]